MIDFEIKDSRLTVADLGFLPMMLSESNPDSATVQLDLGYRHGGGWKPLKGFTITDRGLKYPGDRPMTLFAEAKLRDETIRFYDCSWVAVIQKDGSFEVARMD